MLGYLYSPCISSAHIVNTPTHTFILSGEATSQGRVRTRFPLSQQMKSMHACLQNFRVDIDEDWGLIAAKGGTQRSVLSEIVERGPNAVLELVG
jgi:hypothetical protein